MNEIMNTAEVVNRLRKQLVESVVQSVHTGLSIHEEALGLCSALALFALPDGPNAVSERIVLRNELHLFARKLWSAIDEDPANGSWPNDTLEQLMRGHDAHDLIF